MKKSKLFILLLIVALSTFSVVILILMNIGIIPSVFKGKNKISSDVIVQRLEVPEEPNKDDKIDDWCYEPQETYEESFGITNSKGFSTATDSVSFAGAVANTESTLGYSVGR